MSKSIQLITENTASFLVDNLTAIQQALSAEEFDDSLIFQLINERDELLQHYLTTTAKEHLSKSLIEQELNNNSRIMTLVREEQQAAADKLRLIVKSRKAIKKYR
ncbi:hypothetical protein [Algibacillus agarilyticus]|uniref:hypothetical protein n=1 Tax=Algibacillus agarilyticus TaxID=2234133 RepID=UPI000DD0EC80|nr:hypothetical protein [Algibacillus agarilyticus]